MSEEKHVGIKTAENVDIKPSQSESVLFPKEAKYYNIKNKQLRNQQYLKNKRELRKEKKEAKKIRESEGLPKKVPHTIESLREHDETTVADLKWEENELIREDLEHDELSAYYQQSYEPKVLITYSDNPTREKGLLHSTIREISFSLDITGMVLTKKGKKARLRELGPRFTLKLRSLQKGTFDSKYGVV
ncbi:hypothetical protein NQ318_004451 [Aromia moschata]|uniref:Brix domain-containing protein n=1 Tax=Aromia moschata TaxID=1265417 RepID=A0AAV8YCE5_9CUCU|nr:hypothetical protein NQ318_004451 [Aromia moschata]